ncbi:MAG: type 4a pilus biogenesis protein PilO [Pseudobdellovibrionaceae bacterium]
MIGTILIRLASFSFKKAMIFSGFVGALYYFMFFDDGSKIQRDIETVKLQIAEQEVKAQQADAALKEVEQVRITVGTLSDQFRTVSQALPSEIQMSDIIRTVDTVARASGVSIKSKEPNAPVNKDYYEEIPLKVSMEGSYSELTLFLYYLASTERIMKVNNFAINLPRPDEKVPAGRLIFEGNVMSYRFVKSMSGDPTSAGEVK